MFIFGWVLVDLLVEEKADTAISVHILDLIQDLFYMHLLFIKVSLLEALDLLAQQVLQEALVVLVVKAVILEEKMLQEQQVQKVQQVQQVQLEEVLLLAQRELLEEQALLVLLLVIA